MMRKMMCLLLGVGGCQDDSVSSTPRSQFTESQWQTLQSLAELPDPPPDLSNKYRDNPAAVTLGQKFYFDPSFSGPSTLKDTLGQSFAPEQGRAPLGQSVDISCNSCHDVSQHAGSDPEESHVSIGVGAYDVNGQSTINSAYYDLLYWNGRNDSLWAQIVAVGESPVSMGGNRLKTAWRIADAYRTEYEAVFGADHPLPTQMDTVAAQKLRLDADGTCVLDVGLVCPELCHEVTNTETLAAACVPRFPLHGKTGRQADCQWADATDPIESLKDAFDCMTPEDRATVTRIYVNFAKAIAAYETQLVSRNAAFDAFVAEGPESEQISESAKAGAKLFIGEGWCVQCHGTPLFSDNLFHDIGVPQVGDFVPATADCPEGASCDCVNGTNCLPWGLRDGLAKLQGNKFRRDSSWSDDPNVGVTLHDWYATPLSDAQKGQWRTPSLRSVALTAPYMHNGMYGTLEEVVGHYEIGSQKKELIVGEVDSRVGDMALTEDDVAALVAFMEALTGEELPVELVTKPVLPAPSGF